MIKRSPGAGHRRRNRGSQGYPPAGSGHRRPGRCSTLRTVSAGVPDGWNDETGDFGYLNSRFTYAPPSGNYEISVFGTNLTDEYLLNSGFFHGLWGFDFASVAPPRQAGLSMKVYFN